MASVTPANEFPTLVRLLLQAKGSSIDATIMAENSDLCSDRICRVLRAAVAAGSLADPQWAGALADMKTMVSIFLETLRETSILVRMLADLRRAPLNARVVSNTVALVGQTIGEMKVKPVSRLALAQQSLQPRKAVIITALSSEVILSTSPAGLAMLSSELRTGISAALDGGFIDVLEAGLTPIASTGSTPDKLAADIRDLLNTVNKTGSSRLYFVMGPILANGFATVTTADGIFAFPGMGPSGGEILTLPALVSDQATAGRLLLVDAAQIAADMGPITIDATEHAALRMSDAVTDPAAADVVSSLWQANLRALKAEAWYGAERLSSTAVAALDGITFAAAP